MKNKLQIPKEIIDKINNIYWKYTTGPQIIKKPRDLAVLTSMSSFGKDNNNGPIGVVKCKFNDLEKVTLILLGGTQVKAGQATSMEESKLSTYGKDNDYLDAVLEVFKKENQQGNIIPKENPIIITGISLGGMIAQQLLSKKGIVDNYTIKSIICFGSPLVKPLQREQFRIKRFVEKGDIVPKFESLSLKIGRNRKLIKSLNQKEKIIEDNKYKSILECHALSYVDNNKFNKYDFYGEENGKNQLEILEEIQYFEAPKK